MDKYHPLEFKKDHEHPYCGIFRCCVNGAWLKRFDSCYYHELDDRTNQMTCMREDIIEGWGGGAYCNECWFHVTPKDAEAGHIPE